MQLVEERPNVELRSGGNGDMIVVLSFPYDPHIVAVVRAIPQRRFDWDRREWWAPVDDWAGVHVAEVLDRFPELTTSAQVDAWLAAIERRWVGRVSTTRHDGRGWWVLQHARGDRPRGAAGGRRRARGRLAAGAVLGATAPRRSPSSRARAWTAARAAAWPRWSAARSRRPRAWRSARPSTGPSCASRCSGTPTSPAPSTRCPAPATPATRCRSTRGSSSRSTPSWPCTTSPSTARPRRRWPSCAPSTTRR